jgi:hypothetical protein
LSEPLHAAGQPHTATKAQKQQQQQQQAVSPGVGEPGKGVYCVPQRDSLSLTLWL